MAGVAIAVGLLLVVTGLAVGMVVPATGIGGGEYWVVPEGDADSPLVQTGSPEFGAVGEATEHMESIDGVEAASPVLVEVLSAETPAGETERLVVVGVRPEAGIDVYGLSPTPIDGPDGVVLSDGAASLLATTAGDSVRFADDRNLTVAAVADESGAASAAPIALVDLQTAQAITGADQYDAADRFVVVGSAGIKDDLATVYKRSTVRSEAGLAANRMIEAELPLALSLAALLVSVLVGTLFVAVVTAMEVAADREALATLSAIGVGRRHRIGLYAGQSLLVSVAGGVVGVTVGFGAITLANRVSNALVGVANPVVGHPILAPYGLAAAIAVGCCSVPVVAIVVGRVEAEVGSGV